MLYWLSKHGFECASVDHTGIDLIASNPHANEVMGISVKCRSRHSGTETTSVSIPRDNFEKAEAACRAFGCAPYFAIVVDAGDTIRGFVLSMPHLQQICPVGQKVCSWKMTAASLEEYQRDPAIKFFEFRTETKSWWL